MDNRKALTAPEVKWVLNQAFDATPHGSIVNASDVVRLVIEHGLLPQDRYLDEQRVYHALRNGREFAAVDRGRFTLKPDIEPREGSSQWPYEPGVREITDCIGDDLENLVGGLLVAQGFQNVRFTTSRSNTPDQGRDLIADWPTPMGPRLRHHVAVTGTRMDLKRLQRFRGLAHTGERVLAFAHSFGRSAARYAEDKRFSTVMTCVDAVAIRAALDAGQLTIQSMIQEGRSLRERQFA